MENLLFKTSYKSPFGLLDLYARNDALVGLNFHDCLAFGDTNFYSKDKVGIFNDAKLWLDDYFLGRRPNIANLRFNFDGSEFFKLVMKRLCEIPYGTVTTYKNIASLVAMDLGREKMSAQAVGSAIGRNPLLILIPCHRVIGCGGNLVGYSGGLNNKLLLLEHERVDVSKLSFPK